MTEVGIIPEDWKILTLGDVSSDASYGVGAEAVRYDGKNKYIRITDIDDVAHTYSPSPTTSPSFFEQQHIVKENDLLIARTGASVGKSYVYNKQDGFLIFAGFLMKLNIDKANSNFIFYQTLTSRYKQWVESESARTGQPGLNLLQLKSYKVVYPPLEEQSRIAKVLSELEDIAKSLEAKICKKRQIKEGTMQLLLTGKKRLPGFDGEWITKHLYETGYMKAGGTPSTFNNEYWNGDVNWLQSGAVQNCFVTPNAVQNKITKSGLDNSSAHLIKADSVLIAITGATCANIGYLTFESAANQSVVSIETNAENCALYLYYHLLKERQNILNMRGGSAQGGVTLKALQSLKIRIPSDIKEQESIASILSDMDKEIEKLELERDKYLLIKQGMMQDLLTGKTRLK